MDDQLSAHAIAARLDAVFAEALSEQRTITADELMHAIGLQRTNIYTTYSHINDRRKRHNASLSPLASPRGSDSKAQQQITELKAKNARLRTELKAEQERAAQYARAIRLLTLENYQLSIGGAKITDARGRFGSPAES